MKVPMSWFADYVTLDAAPRDFAAAMTASGTMVESVEEQGKDISGVVTGKITSIEKHPNADKLVVCQVDVGTKTVQIVTGAPNVFEGAVVPVALDGAKLPNGNIKKGKLRGVESFGMMCSDDELGVSDQRADGILILDESVPLGQDMKEVLGLNETVIEFEITPNRPDCLSVIGLAREAAATYGVPFTCNTPVVKEVEQSAADVATVAVQDGHLCPRYTARVVRNVTIKPSPEWMQKRLSLAGIRPINNIVDITNYVMLEYGQPMHAFDMRTLNNASIVVRRAVDGEEMITLDGNAHTLDSSMLVITDGQKPVAIAGVMGGENSEVQDDTTDVLFESAAFHGPSVRKTARKLGMRTESSSRFEKRIDADRTMLALNRACELVTMLQAGEVLSGAIDVRSGEEQPVQIPFRPDKINALLGTNISEEQMLGFLKSLEFKVEQNMVTPPSFRKDVEGEADLAEEVARLYGYNNIPSTLLKGEATLGGKNDKQKAEDLVRSTLTSLGLYETVTYTFMSPKTYEKLSMQPEEYIEILNPLGEDQSIMRTTTIGSMLDVVETNFNYRNEQGAFFELGCKYLKGGENGLALEIPEITIALYGKDADYYKLKGVVEQLYEAFGMNRFDIQANRENETFHPGQCADLFFRGKKAAVMGRLHPLVQKRYGLEVPVFIAVLDFNTIMDNKKTEKRYCPLPKFPAVTRDLAVLVDQDVAVRSIENVFAATKTNLLESYALFDVYRGKQVGEGKKSVAYSLTFRSKDKTLTDADVNPIMDDIISRLQQQLDATLRVG